MFECGAVSKITHGVKLLGKGAEHIKALGMPITIEAGDATQGAIDSIKETGGSIRVLYRTPLLMRQHIKPHKFPEYKELKTPMPPPKRVKKLEKLKEKGLDVEYPRTPWFTDNKEQLLAEAEEKERRMREGQFANLLPQYPADRSPGVGADRPRVERK